MTNDQKNHVGSVVRLVCETLAGLTDEQRKLWHEEFDKIKHSIVYKRPKIGDRW